MKVYMKRLHRRSPRGFLISTVIFSSTEGLSNTKRYMHIYNNSFWLQSLFLFQVEETFNTWVGMDLTLVWQGDSSGEINVSLFGFILFR